ncbi:MAG: histidinol-phosphatase HisJ [SAR324 cluster bacterium]|nr:histidinol-phosphatase HisJ [SAR324 cluster bacterium]
MKWEGHTHSQFCHHGNREKTSLMIEKAISLGFGRYSIVEHAPLPDGIIAEREARPEFGLMWDELDAYFKHLEDLKRIFGDRIEILSGLEIDYFEGLETFTANLLNSFSEKIDDVIISLHFIVGNGGFQPLDYRPEVFEKELLNYYGSIDAVHLAYWDAIERMIDTKLSLPSTKRIGHLGLINKFAGLFQTTSEGLFSIDFFEPLFKKIKLKGWALDFNVAGLKQKWYQDLYINEPMQFWARQLNIELVYGSDAHSKEGVGLYYDRFLEFANNE